VKTHPYFLRRPVAGFSLIELMVAMVLGLIVLGAAIAVFQSNQRSYRSNEGLNRVQEGARVAYEMMSRDIRSAGTSACTDEGQVLGTDANSVDYRAPVTGSATEVTTRSAEDQSYRVSAATANSVTLVTVAGFTPSDVFEADDVVMVCNGAMAGFATVGSVSGQTVNFATPLEFNPADTERAAPGSISIAHFRNTRWQVAGDALVVSRNGGANEQVATGVQNLALSYHQFAGGNPNVYVSAPTDFNYVDAARVGFQVRAETLQEVGGSSNSITRNAQTTVGVRSRIP
jgi:type IV pilus assembly protein PilW